MPQEGTDTSSSTSRRDEKRSWTYIARSGLAGGVAGCVAKTAIAPLDRVKILFQANNPDYTKYSGRVLGVFQAIGDIVRTRGPTALFQGHGTLLFRIFPSAAIKCMTYDKFHFLLMPSKEYESAARLFLAGSASGVLAVCITYPLDIVRVRLAYETKRRSQRHGVRDIVKQIYAESRVPRASYASIPSTSSTLQSAQSSRSQSLSAPSPTTHPSHTSSASRPPLIQHAHASAGAMAAPDRAALSSRMLARFPILNFYRGFTVTVLGMIPYAGTSFVVFGRCRTFFQTLLPVPQEHELRRSHRAWYWYRSKVFQDLAAGGLAGAIAQTVAYPFEVIRRRQQVGGVVRPDAMLGLGETVGRIYRTAGWRGFYVGLSIGYLKVVPMTSISFAVWLGMKRWMDGG